MRLIGPNCLGILNTGRRSASTPASGRSTRPRGKVAFLSQSGALGLAIVDYARKLDLGMSSFVSVGNKADISGNDLIQYWESDERTDVILLYLESFGNPRKFGADRTPGRPDEADRRGEERSLSGGRARHLVAHRRARRPPPT